MKWLFIHGSPRKNGNTSYLLNEVKRCFGIENDDMREHRLYDMEIGPCTDCRRCKAGELECPRDDGMKDIYAHIEGSDCIGSPVYWSGVTAPMKAFIDRLRPYYKNGRMKAKMLLPVLAAADGKEDCDLIEQMYGRVARGLGAEIIGIIAERGFDIGDVEKGGFVGERIRDSIKSGIFKRRE
jgi:multimeric flavodoxin WrbA